MSARKVAWDKNSSSLDRFLLNSIGIVYLYPSLIYRNYKKIRNNFGEVVLNPGKLRLWFYSLLILLSLQYVLLFTLGTFVGETLKVIMLSSVLISTVLFVVIFIGIFAYLASKKLYFTVWSFNKSLFITTKSFTLNLRRLEVDSAFPNLFLFESFLKIRWTTALITGKPIKTEFVKSALKVLPKDGYVIFEFKAKDGKFIQFFNNGKQIVMDIPVYQNSCYAGKYKKLLKILKSLDISRQYRKNRKDENESYSLVKEVSDPNKIVSINLNRNCLLAYKITEKITNEIFKIKEPLIYSFNTGSFR